MRFLSAWLYIAAWAAALCMGFARNAAAWDATQTTAFGFDPNQARIEWAPSIDPFEQDRAIAEFSLAPSRTFFSTQKGPFPSLDEPQQNLEVRFAARTLIPSLQVGVAQRTRVNDGGDDSIRLLGREFRLGDLGVGRFESPTWDNPQWYVFAASDDGAITWTPGARREGVDAWRVQEDRLLVGDFQAGLSVEANGMQAALSYVKRDVGMFGKEEDASFTGVSLTWRR